MVKPAPKIDERDAARIAGQVKQLLSERLPNWQQEVDSNGKPIGVSEALIRIYARFSEIIIERLNKVPDKNFLAFLNLLGASRLPPQPARVPLTFFLTTGSTVDAVVPPRTQVAAPPEKDEKDPVIFETERELIVTAAQLASVFVREPQQDTWSEYNVLLTPSETSKVAIFRGQQRVEHILYIGQTELLEFPEIANLSLILTLSKPLGDSGRVKWQISQDSTWIDVTQDLSQSLSQSGEQTLNLGQIKAVPLMTIYSFTSRWLRCVLETPITLSKEQQQGMVRVDELPKIDQIQLEVFLNERDLSLEAAFVNTNFIDFTKPFFPFGEKPKLGDTLYLAHREAFSKEGATIILQIDNLERIGLLPAQASENLQLQWEYWDGTWTLLGISTLSGFTSAGNTNFADDTRAFTVIDPNIVTFTLPTQPQATTINGIENYWIRVHIISGDYGKEASFVFLRQQDGEDLYVLRQAGFRPPFINSVLVNYQWTKQASPDARCGADPCGIVTYNDLIYQEATQPLIPFQSSFQNEEEVKPSLYLGFTLPDGKDEFPNLPLSLYLRVADRQYGEKSVPLHPTYSRQAGKLGATVTHLLETTADNWMIEVIGNTWDTPFTRSGTSIAVNVNIPTNPERKFDRAFLRLSHADNPSIVYSATLDTFTGETLPDRERVQLSWQYWSGQWLKLNVEDGTENFTRPGLIEWLVPADVLPKGDFNLSNRYWLRVQWEKGDYPIEPIIQWLALNTTLATQSITINNEILGSSNGSENQTFRTTQTPILNAQRLEIRELEIPSVQEREKLKTEEGKDAITTLLDSTGRPQEIWVRWHEVSDFYNSQPRDRHYTLNRLTGEITFGDGLNGLIPPFGQGNLRMTRYQTGGGVIGNRQKNTIVQLKTTVPYIDSVTNYEEASGGADAETLEILKERVPRSIRHGQRAVTLEDYEDLARLASVEVARTKCFPTKNLAIPTLSPGQVSLIIVPRSDAPKPLPSLALLNQVKAYLENHADPTINISVIPPPYVKVEVTVTIALTSLENASQIGQVVERTLARFLHPLTGGTDGTGWAFGREPYESDFYALLETVAGVDHISSLKVDKLKDEAGALKTRRFLVYSGRHTINLVFEES